MIRGAPPELVGVNGTALVQSSEETVSEAPDEGALAAAFDAFVAAAEPRLLGLALALTGERAAALRRLF